MRGQTKDCVMAGMGEDRGYDVSMKVFVGNPPQGIPTGTVWVQGTGQDEGYVVRERSASSDIW